jgi:hypothetical protein
LYEGLLASAWEIVRLRADPMQTADESLQLFRKPIHKKVVINLEPGG